MRILYRLSGLDDQVPLKVSAQRSIRAKVARRGIKLIAFQTVSGPDWKMPIPLKRKAQNSTKSTTRSVKARQPKCSDCTRVIDIAEELNCSTCGDCYHRDCVSLDAGFVSRTDWECPQCKTCTVCAKTDSDETLMFCDECDRATHLQCQERVKRIPKGKWLCDECMAASPQKLAKPSQRSVAVGLMEKRKVEKQEQRDELKSIREERYKQRTNKIEEAELEQDLGMDQDRENLYLPNSQDHSLEDPVLEAVEVGSEDLEIDPELVAIQNTVLSRLYTRESPTLGFPEWLIHKSEIVSLLRATIERGEGNSVVILGNRAGGKSLLLMDALSDIDHSQCQIVTLDGTMLPNPLSALKSLARQLSINLDQSGGEEDAEIEISTSNLLPILTATSQPLLIVLDHSEQFAGPSHPRQALLYVLLDLVQSGRRNGGLCVIGTSSRVDLLDQLEKRVRSRFSQRIIHISPPRFEEWMTILRQVLHVDNATSWNTSIETLLTEEEAILTIESSLALSGTAQSLFNLFVLPVATLNSKCSRLTSRMISNSSSQQRPDGLQAHLRSLSLPSLALLIATRHLIEKGTENFTFPLLAAEYTTWARMRAAAPTSNIISTAIWGQDQLKPAFRNLVSLKLLTPLFERDQSEYARFKCSVLPAEIKKMVPALPGITSQLSAWAKGFSES